VYGKGAVALRAMVVFLFLLAILISHPASAEIFSYIDSKGRLVYTSDPDSLPDGHENKTGQAFHKNRSERNDLQSTTNLTIRIEHLNQRLELAKIEFDTKFENLSETSAGEYNQAVQDILSLKFEIVDLNEELVDLTVIDRGEKELQLQRLYAWSEKVDLLLEKDRQTNGPQARSTRLEVLALSVEEVKRTGSSVTYSIRLDLENPGEEGIASVKVAGKGPDGHVIESKIVKGEIERERSKTLYETAIVAPENALHISAWDVIEASIH